MNTVLNFLFDVWNWSMQARWRTWMFHSIIATGLAFVIGPWAALMIFLARELEQLFNDLMVGIQPDFVDHFLDFASPFVVISALAAFNVLTF